MDASAMGHEPTDASDAAARGAVGHERARTAADPGPLRIAYLVNQYPKVSHTFVRREIQAVERLGISVMRIAIRGWDETLADAQDVAERERTQYVLKDGLGPLIRAMVRAAVRSPRKFASALIEAIRLSRHAERPFPYHLAYLAEACLILEWLRRAHVSHVHAHFGTNSAEVAMLIRLLGGPSYSFTVHGPDEFDKAHALHLDRKVAQARFVVAISSYGRAQLYRSAAYADWSKIEVVHCGIEAAFHAGAERELPQERRLVCVGRLSEQKGQLVLIEALSRLEQGLGNCHLVLAGDGEMRREIEARIAALGLTHAVTITGWISSGDVRREIQKAQALVLPSFQEGLPVVIMEAMVLERPVISTYVAGIPELVVPGETGWLVPAGSIEPLVDALEACLAAPAEALERMGQAGFRRVMERHDIDVEVGKLARLFAEVSPAREMPPV